MVEVDEPVDGGLATVAANLRDDEVQLAITVEQRALDAIEAELNPVVLVSPIDGFVSSIVHNVGESILAGDPILVISSAKAERILAYIRQPIRVNVRPGMTIEVRARSSGRGVGQGNVTGVGAQMELIFPELLPPRNAFGSAGVEYGQPIVISVPAGMRILPGEIVDLHPVAGTP